MTGFTKNVPWIAHREKGTLTSDFNRLLKELRGSTVCVAWVRDPEQGRKNYNTQISVEAELEGNTDTEHYRVLINDQSYSYFFAKDILYMCQDTDKTPKILIR